MPAQSTPRRVALGIISAAPFARRVRAQATWPSRPIRILVPYPAGGSPDAVARLLAERWGGVLGQSVVVENRVGGGGVVGTEAIARAAPDGYTLGVSNNGPLASAPALQRELPYRPLRDFTHLAMLAEFPLALAVAAVGPLHSVAELLAFARTRPGGPTIGTPGTAGTRLTLELMRQRSGAELTSVPYRGGAQAATEVIAGRLDAALAAFGEFSSNERLRVIALLAPERHPEWPALPTLREQGLDVSQNVWFGLCGPAALPVAVAGRLTREADTTMESPEARALTTRLGATPRRALTPAEMTALVVEEGARWAEVVRAGNLQPD